MHRSDVFFVIINFEHAMSAGKVGFQKLTNNIIVYSFTGLLWFNQIRIVANLITFFLYSKINVFTYIKSKCAQIALKSSMAV